MVASSIYKRFNALVAPFGRRYNFVSFCLIFGVMVLALAQMIGALAPSSPSCIYMHALELT